MRLPDDCGREVVVMAKHLKWHWKIIGASCGVLLLCLAGFNYMRLYCKGVTHLKWSGGTVSALRSEMAMHICDAMCESGVALDPCTMSTSESICEAVDKHDLDVGLVLGGFPDDTYKNVRQVATLGVEPLHLLVRNDIDGPASLELLRNHRVFLGERGTNSERLAEQFLEFAGMRPTRVTKDGVKHAGDYEPLYGTEAELLDRMARLRQAAAATKRRSSMSCPMRCSGWPACLRRRSTSSCKRASINWCRCRMRRRCISTCGAIMAGRGTGWRAIGSRRA